jgi:SAM-dependent methyltransferase
MNRFRLNLGCSTRPLSGWVNVDCRDLIGVDQVCDLNTFPWPWEDSSVDEVLASHFLEHLTDPVAAMSEVWRILKPGGKVEVYVPNCHGYLGIGVGHASDISTQWFYDLVGNTDLRNDVHFRFRETHLELRVFHHESRHPVDPVLRAMVRAWERFWNRTRVRRLYWEVLGILVPGEIHWWARK